MEQKKQCAPIVPIHLIQNRRSHRCGYGGCITRCIAKAIVSTTMDDDDLSDGECGMKRGGGAAPATV